MRLASAVPATPPGSSEEACGPEEAMVDHDFHIPAAATLPQAGISHQP